MAHFRRHWKKYLLGSVVVGLLGRWSAKKNRDNNIVREYCIEAKKFGDETVEMITRPKKVFVFLNPEANNKEARKQFRKCSAPLLHLSGMDVIIIESNYEGQIQTLLGYIESSTDALVVAGGGGTIMEVVNGLIRRKEKENIDIPIGIIPVGKENRFFTNYIDSESTCQVRKVCEATMNIIKGKTIPVDVMRLKPEKGKVMYSLSCVEWGAIYSAEKNKNSFRLLGRLRTVCSYINTAVRRWPNDFKLSIWQSPETQDLSNRVNQSATSRRSSVLTESSQTQSHISSTETQSLTSLTNSLLEKDWKMTSLNAIGFKLLLHRSVLDLTVWPAIITKNAFIHQGWNRTVTKDAPITIQPEESFKSTEFTICPYSTEEQWYSIDGEPFEAIPLQCSILHNKIRIFAPDNSNKTSIK